MTTTTATAPLVGRAARDSRGISDWSAPARRQRVHQDRQAAARALRAACPPRVVTTR